MNPFMLWNLVKGFLARKDMRSVLSDLTLRVIKLTSKILIQMMIAKCLLKSTLKNLKRLLIPYCLKDFHGGGKTTSLVVCFKEKIVIPGQLQKHVINWYHTTLCHPGINQTEETIGQHLWLPKMQAYISNYVQICPLCQRNKRRQKEYGLLPPKLAEATP
jgi:hypothetical protein